MKHTKFSKILSVVLTVAVVMLSSVSAFAGAQINAEQDVASTDVNITYTGTAEGINLAGLSVVIIGPATTAESGELQFDETKDIIAGTQVFVDENGNYTGKFTLSNDTDKDGHSVVKRGYYKVIAASNDEVVNCVFYFARPAERKDALKTILTTTSNDTVVSTIDNAVEILGINADFWAMLKTNEEKLNAAACIKANAELKKIDAENIKDTDVSLAATQMDKEIFTAVLNANNGDITDLNAYKDIIANESALTLYNSMKDTVKAKVVELVSGKGYENFAAFNAELEDIIKMAYIVTSGSEIATVYQYAQDLELDKASAFNSLASDKLKSEAVEAVRNAKPKTLDELNTEFTKAVNARTGSGNSGTTGGSSGSGSSTGGTKIDAEVVKPSTPSVKYTDLTGYAWAEKAIYDLTEREVLSGYGDGIFGPEKLIKREEFAKVIVAAMYGEEADKANVTPSFADAQGAWYSLYIGYGEKIGILSGFDANTFGVGKNISRQDIMAILYRVMLEKGYKANTTPIDFTDSADIYDYAKDAVYALANAGVVTGYNGAINPQGEATRAEVAVMVSNFITLFE